MLFKGTASRNPGEIEKEVKDLGGTMNGSVSADLADYHITLPADKAQRALALLKDMMQNAAFDPREIEREREVILNEIRMNNDDPRRKLYRLLNATAYRVHPYRHPATGYEPLLRTLSRDDLLDFYTTRYVPNRMAIAVTGDIEPSQAVAMAEKEFAGFRPGDFGGVTGLPREPLQMDRRYREDETETTLGYLGMAFHSTELTHADLYALDVLSMILGRSDTSRLYTALYKERQLVHTIEAWNYTPRDSGLFIVTAIVSPEKAGPAAEAVMAEIEKLKDTPVTDDELEGARRTTQSDYVFARETTDGIADDITANIILTGSPDFSKRYIAGVNAVIKEDIKRVARQYLTVENLTEVRLMPPPGAAGPAEGTTGVRDASDPRRADERQDRFAKVTLDNGLRVLLHRNDASPSASVTVAMLGGLMAENAQTNGISSMVSRMLFKGTETRSESLILGAIQKMGGRADSFSSTASFGFTIKCLKDDLPACLDIAHDILANSIFPDDELAKEKSLTLAMIKEEDDDLFTRGFTLLRRNLFPGSPLGMRYLGEATTVPTFTRSAVRDFYREHCTADAMVIAVAGDIDPGAIEARIRTLFAGFRRSTGPAPSPVPPAGPLVGATETQEMDKEEALILRGFRSVPLRDPDRYALDVVSSVLSGQSGRIFAELRGKRSLAYSLGCTQKLSMETGLFAFYVATGKEKVTEAVEALSAQVAAITKETIAEQELATARRELSTSSLIDLQSNEFVTSNGALEELCGAGGDAIFTYDRAIDRVTLDDVTRVAQRYFAPDRSATVIITPP